MTVGQRIRIARKNLGLTQKELAECAGTATGTIQQYELGKRKPRIEQLCAIASALGIPVTDLLLGHDPKKREEKTNKQITEEIEQELEDYIEKKDPKSARLARFLANNPEFVSYLRKIGFEFKIDQDNILWAWYKKTYDYEISIEDLEFLESQTQSFIKREISKDAPSEFNLSYLEEPDEED